LNFLSSSNSSIRQSKHNAHFFQYFIIFIAKFELVLIEERKHGK
jgi:hypothetical protein